MITNDFLRDMPVKSKSNSFTTAIKHQVEILEKGDQYFDVKKKNIVKQIFNIIFILGVPSCV